MDPKELAREAAISVAKPYTMTSYRRQRAMADAVLQIERDRIGGDIVECGVWRGGNVIIARKLAPTRLCWLFDTFDGMTAPGPEDRRVSDNLKAADSFRARSLAGQPWCLASLGEVRRCLNETGTLDDRFCRFVVGDVAATLRCQENLPGKIALLRLDTDWYASTKVEMEVLYPRLAVGGILIVDDYGHWHGARKAIDEYFGGPPPGFRRIDYTAIAVTKRGSSLGGSTARP